jgi:alpha-tubulin suppressor-like RCC1 family protein
MVPAPSFSGTTDPTQSPVVIVCQWVTSGSTSACATIVAFFAMAAGIGSEVVRYDTSSQSYIVNWHTDQCLTGACTLDPTLSYRLRVLVGPLELGHADVIVVSNGSQLQNVQTGQDIGLVDGRTLPVQFRIEQGTVAVVAPGSASLIAASGGNIVTSDGHVAVAVPAGALAAPTNLTVATASSFPVGTGAWSAPVDLRPTGTTFAAPVILTLSYDPTKLPPGVPPTALSVYVSDGTGWELVPGGTLNALDNTVSVPISHFSTYALTIAPTVVSGVPSPTTILLGQATTLTGFLFAYHTVPMTICFYAGFPPHFVCHSYPNTYSYPVPNQVVSWTTVPQGMPVVSLAFNRSYTDQSGATTSPPIHGVSAGTAQVVASVFGSPVQSNPVTISVISLTFTALNTGDLQSCGIATGGAAWCWGFNNFGELGNNSRANDSIPVAVRGGLIFSSVSVGGGSNTPFGASHVCGVTTSGAAYCWGYNGFGQLGNNSTTDSHVPVPVVGGLTFSSVSAGQFQTCGLTRGGAVYCWGRNPSGELGSNSTTDSHVPVPVAGAGGLTFSAVSSGAVHTCALTSTGAPYCWGNNFAGQLGNNSTTSSPVPVAVVGGVTFSVVSAGQYHTCGLSTGGTAYCWGTNGNGQLGNNTTMESHVPGAVAGGLIFSSLSGGLQYTCGVATGGVGYCWGAAGVQLGNNNTADSPVPVAVAGGLTFALISAGGHQSCGLTTGDVAYCWGAGAWGQLGDNSTGASGVPVRVAGQP